MSKLLLSFYGDDFTGSTDALEQLTLAGVRAALFIQPPTRKQLARFKDLQAVGVAGLTRSMTPEAMERELRPALKKLRALGAPHVHYKVCSTFDSSPAIGSIGRVIDVATRIFPAPFVPLLVAAPALGRYCVFGNLYARFGIGSAGAIHRLDRHPAISKHPITPMREADLRLHLARQTKKRIGLFDIFNLRVPQPLHQLRPALEKVLSDGAEIVLFDALFDWHLQSIGELMDCYASRKRPLFSVGSSGIEAALGRHWMSRHVVKALFRAPDPSAAGPLLVGSGSCSPVTTGQIRWALANGFAGVVLDTASLASRKHSEGFVKSAITTTVGRLRSGRSVIVHISRRQAGAGATTAARSFGEALGTVLRGALAQTGVRRVCVAGGDTSSYAARVLGIEALEMIAPLMPGAPVCRAYAPGSPVNGREVVFKGGQVGAEDCFGRVLNGGAN